MGGKLGLQTTVLLALGIVGIAIGLLGIAPQHASGQETTTPTVEVRPQLDAAPAAGGEATSYKSLFEILRSGGVMMIPLFVCSFFLTVFLFERAISLRRGRVIPRPFVKRFMHQVREGKLDRDGALELCEESSSPVAAVLSAVGANGGGLRSRSNKRSSTPKTAWPRACGATSGCSAPWPRSARCWGCWAPWSA